MSRIILFLLSLIAASPTVAQSLPDAAPLETLLERLDKAIDHKETFRSKTIGAVNRLKQQATQAKGHRRAELYEQIFEHYVRLQTDSAFAYIDRIEELSSTDDTATRDYISLGRSEIFAVAGLYSEAKAELDHMQQRGGMPDALKLRYYHQRRTLYGWMADYSVTGEMQERLKKMTQTYRDSILLLEPKGIGRDIVMADYMLNSGSPKEALHISLKGLHQARGAQRSYTLYNIAMACRQLGKTDETVRYLALTAIQDIEAGVTEYIALQELAQLLYERGDVERAYTYLLCSMEDANYCKARLRAIEATSIFPIINQAYKQYEQSHRQLKEALFYGLGAFLLVLVAAIFYLRRQMKKLAATRRQLADANAALQKVNTALQDANGDLLLTAKIKEEYIAHYLDRCRAYIDRIENGRRAALKHLKAKQTDELYRILTAEEAENAEQENFFADFDKAFLKLFPNFIEKFNDLLEPEARITPKNGEMLTTELRIFALIRLGVNDSNRIAHFLNYSLATIYNYRSRFRNRALCGKADFEHHIMDI